MEFRKIAMKTKILGFFLHTGANFVLASKLLIETKIVLFKKNDKFKIKFF